MQHYGAIAQPIILFGRGQLMTSSESDFSVRLFFNGWKLISDTSKKLFHGGVASLASFWLRYCYWDTKVQDGQFCCAWSLAEIFTCANKLFVWSTEVSLNSLSVLNCPLILNVNLFIAKVVSFTYNRRCCCTLHVCQCLEWCCCFWSVVPYAQA